MANRVHSEPNVDIGMFVKEKEMQLLLWQHERQVMVDLLPYQRGTSSFLIKEVFHHCKS